jgi:hypothetical protein
MPWLDSATAPTRRELVLVAVLLVFLLFSFSGTRIEASSEPEFVHEDGRIISTSGSSANQAVFQPEDSVVRWNPGKGDIPRTHVVAHVPGTYTTHAHHSSWPIKLTVPWLL